MSLKIQLIGYDSGWGSRDAGCEAGPQALDLPALARELSAALGCDVACASALGLAALGDRAAMTNKVQTLPHVVESRRRLMRAVDTAIEGGFIPVVIGGDHSSAAGTWAAAARARDCVLDFDLYWIDAHMDSHTPATAHEGKWGGWWHGMPVACLIGEGPEGLSDGPVLSPDGVHMIGIRSYEPGEAKFLERYGIIPVMAAEVAQNGLPTIGPEGFFGISIDLDSFDPAFAPGVGSPEPDGLDPDVLCAAISGLGRQDGFIGLEIVEYNPANDTQDRRTAALVPKILRAVFGG
jgi:arginase